VYLFVPAALLLPVSYGLHALPLAAALRAVVLFLSLFALANFVLVAAMDPGARARTRATRGRAETW
jgi:hypothetical protein